MSYKATANIPCLSEAIILLSPLTVDLQVDWLNQLCIVLRVSFGFPHICDNICPRFRLYDGRLVACATVPITKGSVPRSLNV